MYLGKVLIDLLVSLVISFSLLVGLTIVAFIVGALTGTAIELTVGNWTILAIVDQPGKLGVEVGVGWLALGLSLSSINVVLRQIVRSKTVPPHGTALREDKTMGSLPDGPFASATGRCLEG